MLIHIFGQLSHSRVDKEEKNMSSMMTTENILTALENLKSELPSLAGQEAWGETKDKFNMLKQRLQDSNDFEERDALASELVNILVNYNKHTRDRLNDEIRRAHIRPVLRDTMETDLPAFAAKMGLDSNIVEPSADVALKSIIMDFEESGVRLVTIKEGGTELGKSVKVRNFHLDLSSMTELIAGSIMTVNTVILQPDPHIVVAGVLLIINSLTGIIKIQLLEEDTAVFWGLVLAQEADNSAEESLIVKHTNEEREKYGRLPLTNEVMREALHRLEKIKSVELVEGKQDIWRIVEKYEIK